MKTKVPRVVRKIKHEGKWIFAAVPKKGESFDFRHVLIKGKLVAAAEGTFHLDYSEGGKRRRPSIGDDPAAVKRALATQQNVLDLRKRGIAVEDAPEILRRVEGKPLASVLASYLESPPVGIGRNTLKKYKSMLAEFVAWAATAGITHAPMVDDAVLDRYIRYQQARAISAKTIVNKAVFLSAELKRNGCTFGLRRVDLPRVMQKKRRIYTIETLQTLFAACPPDLYQLFQTFLLTGMREQEVANLADTDIDEKLSIVHVTAKPHLGFTPKSYEERSISVPRRLIEILKTRLDGRRGLVFATSDIWASRVKGKAGGKPDTKMLLKLKRQALRAGLNCGRCVSTAKGKRTTCATSPVCSDFTLHKFRHTYATFMLRDRMDIESLRRQLGHADLATTQIYLHALEAELLQPEVETSSLARIL